MTIGYVKQSDYKGKDLPEQFKNSGKTIKTQPSETSTGTRGEVIEISHEKLPPIPEKSTFMLHHNSYPKLKVDLEDADISPEMRQNLSDWQ